MLAKGCAGTVPQKDKQKMDGLTIAYTAQTAVIQKARTPCFGMMHTKLRGEGGRVAERNLFLAVQLLHKPLKPDIVLVRGKHTLPRCNFSCYYDEAGIRAGDPASGAVLDSLDDDDRILCLDWNDYGGFKFFE